MMDAERKLAEVWADDAPPARDAVFTMHVLARMEQRRLWNDLADLVPLVIVVGVLAWALAPTAQNLLSRDPAGFGAGAFLLVASVIGGIWLALAANRRIQT